MKGQLEGEWEDDCAWRLGGVPWEIYFFYLIRCDEPDELYDRFDGRYSQEDIGRWCQWLDENWVGD